LAQLRDVMTPAVLTTSGERPVAEVTKLMVQARVGSAVVMQGPWLIGILTERETCCERPPPAQTSPPHLFPHG
jgi:CBS domain-containing protein